MSGKRSHSFRKRDQQEAPAPAQVNQKCRSYRNHDSSRDGEHHCPLHFVRFVFDDAVHESWSSEKRYALHELNGSNDDGLAYAADFAAIGLICVRWAPLTEVAMFIRILTAFTPTSAILTNVITGYPFVTPRALISHVFHPMSQLNQKCKAKRRMSVEESGKK
ncbi:hypothetical protein OSTOST_08488 [Ostertagia ostertagi]